MVKFEFGCDFETFKTYYNDVRGNLGSDEVFLMKRNPEWLIIWKFEHKIVGHCIWHPASVEFHKPYENSEKDPRDKKDKEILRRLCDGNIDFIELHEVWLKKEERGKGYGNIFFEFFEDFIKNKGYKDIVYYADHPAAIAICRKRGYKEVPYEEHGWYTLYKKLG